MSGTIGLTLTANPTTLTTAQSITGTAVYGSLATDWTLTNQTTLVGNSAPANSIYGYGVLLAGNGTIINTAGAKIEGGNIGIVIEAAGTVINAGTIAETGYNGVLTYGFGVELDAGGVITNSAGGLIIGYYGVSLRGGTLVNAGTVENLGNGSTAAVNFAPASSPSLLDLQSGSTLIGDVGGFVAGDTIELSGQTITSQSFSNGTLDVYSGNSLLLALALNEPGSASTSDFTFSTAGGSSMITTDIPSEVSCFCAGTRIATPRGQIPIERLNIGDIISTHRGPKKIKWIGTSTYSGRFLAKHLLPIKIRRHAIAHNIPSRDLYVSPDHAIAESGVLIHAHLLTNGISITQLEAVDQITYFHLELESHALLLAENLSAESFIDEHARHRFHNAQDFHTRYPEQKSAQTACLPRVSEGFHLANIQSRIATRAGLKTPAELGPLCGVIDEFTPTLLRGWAQNSAAPNHPVTLEIISGTQTFKIIANTYREDLRAAGLGHGRHAFAIPLPNLTTPPQIRRLPDGAPLAPARAKSVMADLVLERDDMKSNHKMVRLHV